MTHVNDAAVLALKQLAQEGHRTCLEQACTINTLRAKLAQLESVTSEMTVAGAEAAVPLQALDEFTTYLMERTRAERAANGETGLWTKGAFGNSIALTVYQDLCTKLDEIRTGYGL